MRNVLILLGIVVTSLGMIFFATEFIESLSDWGRVASLVLLTIIFVSLGVYFEVAPQSDELVDKSGWRWLRVTTALYILAVVAAFASVIVFLTIEQLDRLVKVSVTMVLGLALILVASRRFGRSA
jgi:hypothetical protein